MRLKCTQIFTQPRFFTYAAGLLYILATDTVNSPEEFIQAIINAALDKKEIIMNDSSFKIKTSKKA